jgi:crossover junction endodeoxyribonuclease RuvC
LTGTGLSDGETTWRVSSTGKKDDDLATRWRRLQNLQSKITALGKVDLVLIEQPAYSKSGGHMHDRSGVWWMVVNVLLGRGTPVVEVTPSSLKLYATGKGNAGKPQLLEAAVRRLPHIEHYGDDNRVDALWLAAMGLDHLGLPLCDMPVTHRKALDKVRWT